MKIFDRVPVVGVEDDPRIYRIPRQFFALLLWVCFIRCVEYGLAFVLTWPITGPDEDVVVVFLGIAALVEMLLMTTSIVMFVDWICRESKMQYDRDIIARACNTKKTLPRSSAR